MNAKCWKTLADFLIDILVLFNKHAVWARIPLLLDHITCWRDGNELFTTQKAVNCHSLIYLLSNWISLRTWASVWNRWLVVISFCPAQNVPEWAHKCSIKILNQISTHAHFEVYNLRPFSAYRTQCTQTLVHSPFSTPKKRQFQNLWSVDNGDTLDWMCL